MATPDPAPLQPLTLPPRDVNVIVAGSLLAMFLAALDQTIVATVLTAIAADLGGLTLVSWIITAYLLTSTCATLIMGKLSDMYGRRPLILAAIGIFLLGSTLAGFAQSMPMLIAARAIQGIGGGAIITVVQSAVADVVAPRERGRFSGYYAIVFATAALLGPIVGAQITHHAGWPWIFWINLPLGLLAMLVVDRALRRVPVHASRAAIDYVAIATFSIAATSLLLFVSTGGVRLPWTSAPMIACGVSTVVFGSLFIRRQVTAAEPILAPRLLTDRAVVPIYLGMFCIFGCYLATIVTVPIYLQIALNVPLSEVGLLLIPMTLFTSVAAGFGGRFTRAKGRYKPPPLFSLAVAITALVTLAAYVHTATPTLVGCLLLLVGLGMGPCFPCSMVGVQNAVPRRDIGAATGGLVFFRALGGAMVTAAASALLLGLIAAWVPGASGVGGLENLVRQPLTPVERGLVVDAFRVAFCFIAGVLATGWLIFWQVHERPLRTSDDIVREGRGD